MNKIWKWERKHFVVKLEIWYQLRLLQDYEEESAEKIVFLFMRNTEY